jgi:hypothetical protein
MRIRNHLYLANSILHGRVMKADEEGGALDDGGFSLAELADIDLEGIEEVRFEDFPKGVYDWEVNMSSDAKDGEPRYKIQFDLKVLEMLSSIEPGVDLEKWAGKSHTEKFFVYPRRPEEDAAKAIGRIKAFLIDMGLELVKGEDGKVKLGDSVRNAKGHGFRARLERQQDRNDATRSYARLRLEAKK